MMSRERMTRSLAPIYVRWGPAIAPRVGSSQLPLALAWQSTRCLTAPADAC